MDNKQIREKSIWVAKKLGLNVPRTLPLLDATQTMRDVSEIVSRLLAMNAVAASAYGFDKKKALDWLNHELMTDSLDKTEREFLSGNIEPSDRFKLQIEGMWALAWAIGIVDDFDFTKDCDSRFVTLLPNLKIGQSSSDFQEKVKPRRLEQIAEALDLGYCLDWAIRESELRGQGALAGLKPHVVRERRKALEWLLSEEPWEEVSLDT